MNITTINQLVSVNILLDQDEALAALKDPRELQRNLREVLGDIAPVTLRHNDHRKSGPKGKGKARGGKAPGSGSASTTRQTTCSVCGETFKARGLGIHMAQKHKYAAAPTASD